jgi:phosphoribosylamine--glycine ligase
LRLLVVGGGGREHALVWRLAGFHPDVWCAPGNAGIAQRAECVGIDPLDTAGLVRLARQQRVDLTVVGPEAPLAAGLADEFGRQGLAVFGPTAAGARLEGDKAFTKQLMLEAAIPTAASAAFSDYQRALNHARAQRYPLVVKASGLAAGKGVVIVRTPAEAERVLAEMMIEARLGKAGSTVVLEEFLDGEEVSIIALCDGRVVKCLAPSQDHKRLLDNDEGPNTGGMGAYAPAPFATAGLLEQVDTLVFRPLLRALRERGIEYRGVIYAGLMLTGDGLKVLEFNCRFGDPEAQVILPLLEGDLAEMALACCEGRLDRVKVESLGRSALCVVAAAEGYPGSYRKGLAVSGDLAEGEDVVVFHAGTRQDGDRVVTAGGRVLGVTGIGDSLVQARDRAYRRLSRIHFEGMFHRQDIGARGIARLGS